MTFFNVPRVAVTVMPADGLASVTPFAGVIVTAAAGAAALVLGVAAAGLTWLVLCPAPEHAAASSVSAARAAAQAGRLSHLPGTRSLATSRASSWLFILFPAFAASNVPTRSGVSMAAAGDTGRSR